MDTSVEKFQVSPAQSPFDAIRHIGPDDLEYWFARELMPLLQYSRWENFCEAVEKAQAALAANGEDPQDHIRDATNMVQIGSGAQRGVHDYRLTRYGAYAVVQASDARKPRVAEAWAYFRIKTREAEVSQQLDEVEVARRWLAALEAKKELEVRNAQLAIERDQAWSKATELQVINQRNQPKVDYADHCVNPTEDLSLLRDFARELGLRETALREYLIAHHRIYGRWVGRRREWMPYVEWSTSQGGKPWFTVRKRHDATWRGPDGQVPTTLFITPVGKAGVIAMMRRDPIEGAGVASLQIQHQLGETG